MIFFYHPSAGEKKISLEEEFFRYLILSRRQRVGEKISVRNLKDENLYEYEITEIKKKNAVLEFVGANMCVRPKISQGQTHRSAPTEKQNKIHLAWGICDFKTITKTLPFLNELGVKQISFIWSERSQKIKNFPLEKLEKILISSCEQCGRTDLMELNIYESTEKFLAEFPQTNILDFGGKNFPVDTVGATHPAAEEKQSPFLIGPEGGFTDKERNIFDQEKIFSFENKNVLRSETAAVKIASIN